MRVVERFVTSARPAIVWQVLADVEHWHEWTPTVLAVEPLGNTGFCAGARYRVAQPMRRPAIYEVTECVPGHRFTWVQKSPGGLMIADHRITQLDGGAGVELSFSTSGLLVNIVGKVFFKMISDYVETEAHSLKSHCDVLAQSQPMEPPSAV